MLLLRLQAWEGGCRNGGEGTKMQGLIQWVEIEFAYSGMKAKVKTDNKKTEWK